jgi:hypothetical protein
MKQGPDIYKVHSLFCRYTARGPSPSRRRREEERSRSDAGG